MTREEMIEILIEDRLTDWVFAHNYYELEILLWEGWKGYSQYSDEELLEEIEMHLGQNDIEELQNQIKLRKGEYRKREEDEKKGIIKDPFE